MKELIKLPSGELCVLHVPSQRNKVMSVMPEGGTCNRVN